MIISVKTSFAPRKDIKRHAYILQRTNELTTFYNIFFDILRMEWLPLEIKVF